jgi:hypothetical protein
VSANDAPAQSDDAPTRDDETATTTGTGPGSERSKGAERTEHVEEPEPARDASTLSRTDRVIRLLGDDADQAWVRRKIVVFRRLEPDDVRSPGSHVLDESPYLEARLVELAIPKRVHDEMTSLAAKRRAALATTGGLFVSYDPAGWLLAAGGGGLFGVWFDFLPRAFTWGLLGMLAAGVVLGLATRSARARAEKDAQARWDASPEKKEYDALAKELAAAWARAQATLKRETGFHTVIRVAEGSADPMRLASIDPRPYAAEPPTFDPDDFLPTEDGGAVRYEQVHATGEVITQALHGTEDLRQ